MREATQRGPEGAEAGRGMAGTPYRADAGPDQTPQTLHTPALESLFGGYMLRSTDVEIQGHSLAITYEPIEGEAPWVARVLLRMRVNRPRRGHPIWLVAIERDITAYYEQRNRITGEWAHYALVNAIDDAAWQDLQDYNEARADEAADLEADERRLTC